MDGTPPRRIPQLDGIRGIAILLVLLWHYSAAIPSDPGTPLAYVLRLFVMMWSGVDLFFVLSGFLIGGILIDSRQSPTYFKAFYVRRAFRILPLYFLVLAAGILFMPYNPRLGDLPPLWTLVTFTQNIWQGVTQRWDFLFAHSWSLAVEEQFYLVLPVVIYFVPRRNLFPLIVSLIIAAIAWRLATMLALPNAWATANYVLLPARMDALLIGVLCAMAIRSPVATAVILRSRNLLYAATAILLAYPITGTVFGWHNLSGPNSSLGYSVMAMLYACVILLALTERDGVVLRVTQWPPLRRLGVLAYCVYLIHPFAIRLTLDAIATTWIAFTISVIITLSIAELSWRYFEQPLLSVGNRANNSFRPAL